VIQSVDRAVRILIALQGVRTMSLGEIAGALQLPPSTVHGIVRTLVAHGMVTQESDTGRYRLGPATLRLGSHLSTGQLARMRMRLSSCLRLQVADDPVYHEVLVVTDLDIQREPDETVAGAIGELERAANPSVAKAGGRGMQRDIVEWRQDTIGREAADQGIARGSAGEQEIIDVAVMIAIFRNNRPARAFHLLEPGECLMITIP